MSVRNVFSALFASAVMTVILTLGAAANAGATPIVMTGDGSDNLLFFSGANQAVSRTFVNPYDATTVTLNGTFNINNAIYDGAGGIDTLLATNFGDVFVQDDTPSNLEVFLMGDGDDAVFLASLLNPFLANPVDPAATTDIITFLGEGNDIFWGGSGKDYVSGAGGNDLINGGPGDDSLFGEDGSNTIFGGDGIDTAGYEGISSLVLTRLAADVFSVAHPGGVDLLRGVEFITADGTLIDLSTIPLDATEAPEPSTMTLLGSVGIVALIRQARRRANKK